jgi:hypothetical protein
MKCPIPASVTCGVDHCQRGLAKCVPGVMSGTSDEKMARNANFCVSTTILDVNDSSYLIPIHVQEVMHC